MSIGVFDVATSGEDEQRMQKQAMHDRIAAAVYDVREKHGEWLFGANDLDGFNDRAKLAFTSICQTIEPHLHARTGVHRKVMKTLEHEWRERQACYPGCDKDEAHAKKFHGDDEGSDEKEARRRQANNPFSKALADQGHREEDAAADRRRQKWINEHGAGDVASGQGFGEGAPVEKPRRQADGPPVSQDPDRAHQVLDQTHQKADELAQKHHQIIDRAHEKVDERAPGTQGLLGAGEGPRGPVGGFGGPDPYGDPMGAQDPHGGDPLQDLLGTPLGQHFQEQGPSFGKPVQPPIDPNHFARRYHAEFEDQPDHPELDTHETYEPHTYEKLEPKGDFDGYKSRVDQGAEGKVDHDFTAPDSRSSSPYSVEHHDDDGSHNFVPTVTGARAFPEYQRIAAMIQADISAPPGAPGMGGSGAPQGATAPNGAAQMSSTAPVDSSTTAPAGAGAGGTTPVDPSAGAPMTASREYQAILGMVRTAEPLPGQPTPIGGAAPVGGIGTGNTAPMTNVDVGNMGGPNVATQSVPGHVGSKASKWALKQIQEVGTKEARKRLLAVARSHGVIDDKSAARVHALLTHKVADSNYLQKADEALTKVLNEKAEEFQNTIAPLQQALITIQQAEQIANPLNVSPPAGTVNVLPGQQQAGGAGAAMGGASGAAMDATGGGVGMGVDPAAAGLAGQPATQAMQANRKRGGRGKGQRG